MVSTAFLGLQAIGTGQNDVSSQTDPPTAANIAKGIDVIIPATMAVANDASKLVVQKSIKSLADLKGKKVIWMGGTGGEFEFIKFLKGNNFDVKDIEHVNLPPPEAVAVLVKGDAAAMWFWQPWPRKAMALAGDALPILGSSGKYYEPNFHLTVRRGFAEEKPETLRRFLKALKEATDQLNADRDAAVGILQRRLRITVEEAKVSMGDYRLGLWLDGKDYETIHEVSEFKKKLGHIKKIRTGGTSSTRVSFGRWMLPG